MYRSEHLLITKLETVGNSRETVGNSRETVGNSRNWQSAKKQVDPEKSRKKKIKLIQLETVGNSWG